MAALFSPPPPSCAHPHEMLTALLRGSVLQDATEHDPSGGGARPRSSARQERDVQQVRHTRGCVLPGQGITSQRGPHGHHFRLHCLSAPMARVAPLPLSVTICAQPRAMVCCQHGCELPAWVPVPWHTQCRVWRPAYGLGSARVRAAGSWLGALADRHVTPQPRPNVKGSTFNVLWYVVRRRILALTSPVSHHRPPPTDQQL